MFKNILWGVDGILFDTYPAMTYALSKTVNELGVSIGLNVIDGLARQSISHCLETLSLHFKLNPNLFRRRFYESYWKVDPANQLPFPGVREVCKLIHARGGLNIVVTHRDLQSTQMLMEAHNLASHFADIFSVEQGYPLKPKPAMVLAALEKYSLNPDETLLIGDREIDIQAGRAASVRTLLVGGAKLPPPADFQIDHYSQLLILLQKENQ
jgi:HAD superfamily hydrolase (TIGR01509 family)